MTFEHSSEESIHVVRGEGWIQRAHFIRHATQGPNVRFKVIGLVLPDLGTGVVGRASLGVQQAIFGQL